MLNDIVRNRHPKCVDTRIILTTTEPRRRLPHFSPPPSSSSIFPGHRAPAQYVTLNADLQLRQQVIVVKSYDVITATAVTLHVVVYFPLIRRVPVSMYTYA